MTIRKGGHRYIDYMKTEHKHLQAKERGLRRNQPWWHAGLGLVPPEPSWENQFVI
jgi:hypothetical protein